MRASWSCVLQVLLENLPQQLHPKKTSKKVASDDTEEDVERRVSVRATECAFKYKQILIKKNQKYTQIWLNTHTKMKNALNPMVSAVLQIFYSINFIGHAEIF